MAACRSLSPEGGILHIHENVTHSRAILNRRQSSVDSGLCCELVIADDEELLVDDGSGDEIHTKNGIEIHTKNGRGAGGGGEIHANKNGGGGEILLNGKETNGKSSTGIEISSTNGEFNQDLHANVDSSESDSAIEDCCHDGDEKNSGGSPSASIRRKISAIVLSRIEEEAANTEHILKIRKSFSDEFWPSLDPAWRTFATKTGKEILKFLNNMHDDAWACKILRVGKIKSYAPRIDHLVLDLECRPARLI